MIKTKKNKGIEIDLTGPQGNVFFLIGTARNLAKQLGLPTHILHRIANTIQFIGTSVK